MTAQDLIQSIKAEIEAQVEPQDEVEEIEIAEIPIKKLTQQIKVLFEVYPKLQALGFNQCELVSLDSLPNIADLQTLSLESNLLTGDSLSQIAKQYKQIKCLSLAQNQISKFEDLNALKQCPDLLQLDLTENPITQLKGYFQKVFELLPNLKILDNKDQNGQEVDYSMGSDEDEIDDGLDDDEDLEDMDDDDDNDEDDEGDSEPQVNKKVKQ